MSNFLFWSRDSADTAAIAKALATANVDPTRITTQGSTIEELPSAGIEVPRPSEASSSVSPRPAIKLADLRASLPTPQPSSNASSGGSIPSSAGVLRGTHVRPSSVPLGRPFASHLFAHVRRPSSTPSTGTRSRSRSRTRMPAPQPPSSWNFAGSAATATTLPTPSGSASAHAASAVATAVPASHPPAATATTNPYPVPPLFPDNSAGTSGPASQLPIQQPCSLASAACYPFADSSTGYASVAHVSPSAFASANMFVADASLTMSASHASAVSHSVQASGGSNADPAQPQTSILPPWDLGVDLLLLP